ncbi:MAG: hypothetical protein KGK07_16965, partial [Chloroflexota bacterium]|nr:hypothetical protein [Chloroflexota bacterium]
PYSPFDEPGVVIGAYGLMHLSLSTHVLGAGVSVAVRNALGRVYPELVAGHLVAPGQPRGLSVRVQKPF